MFHTLHTDFQIFRDFTQVLGENRDSTCRFSLSTALFKISVECFSSQMSTVLRGGEGWGKGEKRNKPKPLNIQTERSESTLQQGSSDNQQSIMQTVYSFFSKKIITPEV